MSTHSKYLTGVVTVRRLAALFVFLSLAIPSFINVRFDHDWGDDFAMYIIEAKKIATGQSLLDLGYVYDRLNAGGGPPAYPVGFPLMLAPIYYFFGISFRHFHYLMSALSASFGLLTFLYLRKRIGVAAGAYALVFFLAFNPWLIDFKNAVLSDLPFAVFALLAVMAIERRSPYWAGLAMGFALTIRSAGVALIAGLILDSASRWLRPSKESRRTVLAHALITFVLAIVVRLVISFVFKTPSSESGYRDQILPAALLWEIAKSNGAYYVDVVRDFVPAFQTQFLTRFLWISLVWCSVVGFFRRVRMGPQMSEFFVVAYLGMILLWNSRQGFRFLLPVVPMMLYYIGLELSGLGTALFGSRARYAPAVGVLVIFLAFFPFVSALERSHRTPLEGPMAWEAQQAYEEIRRRTPPDAIFIADKPRALALFTDRGAAFDVPNLPPDQFGEFVKRRNIRYELIDLAGESARNGAIKKQIPPDIGYTDVWSNSRYLILKLDW